VRESKVVDLIQYADLVSLVHVGCANNGVEMVWTAGAHMITHFFGPQKLFNELTRARNQDFENQRDITGESD
jgi:hypothetical protein